MNERNAEQLLLVVISSVNVKMDECIWMHKIINNAHAIYNVLM